METHVSMLPLIAMFAVPVGLVITLFLFSKLGTRARICLGIVAGLDLFGAIAALFLIRSEMTTVVVEPPEPVVVPASGYGPITHRNTLSRAKVQDRPATAVSSDSLPSGSEDSRARVIAQSPPLAAAIQRESPAWQSTDLPGFKPDIYPSAEAAVRGLVNDVLGAMSKVLSDDSRLESAEIFGQVPSEILTTVATEFRRGNPASRIRTSRHLPDSRPLSQADGCITVGVEMEDSGTNQKVGTPQPEPWSGSVRIRVTGRSGIWIGEARFIDKPWFDSLARFISQNPGKHYVLAQSPTPLTTSSQAEQEALRDAARKLAPYVSARLRGDSLSLWPRTPSADQARLEQMILAELPKYVIDRFVQSFSRPYGQVWRQALLVDASDKTIASLASACERQIRSDRRSWIATLASIVALVVVICLVYVFLNVMTRGYYTGMLRAAAAGMALFGIAATLYVAWAMGARFM